MGNSEREHEKNKCEFFYLYWNEQQMISTCIYKHIFTYRTFIYNKHDSYGMYGEIVQHHIDRIPSTPFHMVIKKPMLFILTFTV
ncbi:hypothetical protein VP59_03405 [Bacillus pumilus]|nr:hypothetical protein VP59_03405 [Bacillus pumilus]